MIHWNKTVPKLKLSVILHGLFEGRLEKRTCLELVAAEEIGKGNFHQVTHFLVVASTLILIKSRSIFRQADLNS